MIKLDAFAGQHSAAERARVAHARTMLAATGFRVAEMRLGGKMVTVLLDRHDNAYTDLQAALEAAHRIAEGLAP